MTFTNASRDFGARPANRYAALRMGVAAPKNQPVAASDLHRLTGRIVGATVLAVIALCVAVILPVAFEALGNLTAVYDSLSPAAH